MARVVVVGGSIGGLTAALLLLEAGHDVVVLERSMVPLEGRGAGIVLHDLTARYLIERAGMTLDEISEGAKWFRFLDRSGATAHEEPCRYRFTAWSTLYANLFGLFPSERYRFGHEVIGLDERGDQVLVTTSRGSGHEADLVVCADGITSGCRSLLLPGLDHHYSGYLGWRGVVQESELDRQVFDRLYQAITYFTPPLSHILSYPIPAFRGGGRGQRILNYVWYRNLEPGPMLDDVLTDIQGERRSMSVAPGQVQGKHIEDLRAEAIRLLPADMADLVLATRQPFIQTVVDVGVPRMVFGRVGLIGDAAFAARPHAAAGTAKAAADAWDLVAALGVSGSDVTGGLRAWEPGAIDRGSRLVARSRRLGNMAQIEGTFRPGDPYILFGLDKPGDSCY